MDRLLLVAKAAWLATNRRMGRAHGLSGRRPRGRAAVEHEQRSNCNDDRVSGTRASLRRVPVRLAPAFGFAGAGMVLAHVEAEKAANLHPRRRSAQPVASEAVARWRA